MCNNHLVCLQCCLRCTFIHGSYVWFCSFCCPWNSYCGQPECRDEPAGSLWGPIIKRGCLIILITRKKMKTKMCFGWRWWCEYKRYDEDDKDQWLITMPCRICGCETMCAVVLFTDDDELMMECNAGWWNISSHVSAFVFKATQLKTCWEIDLGVL